MRYLNRLSDLLFILARSANAGAEPLWEPGRFRYQRRRLRRSRTSSTSAAVASRWNPRADRT